MNLSELKLKLLGNRKSEETHYYRLKSYLVIFLISECQVFPGLAVYYKGEGGSPFVQSTYAVYQNTYDYRHTYILKQWQLISYEVICIYVKYLRLLWVQCEGSTCVQIIYAMSNVIFYIFPMSPCHFL